MYNLTSVFRSVCAIYSSLHKNIKHECAIAAYMLPYTGFIAQFIFDTTTNIPPAFRIQKSRSESCSNFYIWRQITLAVATGDFRLFYEISDLVVLEGNHICCDGNHSGFCHAVARTYFC